MSTRADFAMFFMMLALAQAPSLAAVPAVQKQYQLVNPGPAGFTLKLADAAVRTPVANEVLVRVRAASLNRRDIYVIDGQYPIGSRTSLVPLSDGAGEVAAVGPGVKRFRVGDRVAANFFQSWVRGNPAADTPTTALGGALDGMLTEYVTLNEAGLVKIPANLSFEEAATLPCAGVTAWNGLVTRGHTQAGDYVLLEGTGGVSMFGLQFAAALGAKPIITSSSDTKLERAKALGAVGLINYKKNPDWEKSVMELTGGAGAQHILDVGGKDTLPHALASLGSGGNLALIGGLGGFGGDIPSFALMGRNASAFGIYVGSVENFEAMNAFIEKHKMKPVIDRTFDYQDAKGAFDLMRSGDFVGKIVIRINGI
ncbi:MAG TPA: NAD(P)-dependent alcohol dehydrogenase [Steroidobacteraceae bacterium]|nr:NAD(P)-dependent alcohol dehydrogenase [Steroidobacteraceae bacterium]